MDQALIRGLEAHGVDVISAAVADMIDRVDQEHLDYATRHQRVICTCNVGDFYQLHTEYQLQGRKHAGILVVPQQRYSVGEQLRRMLKLIATRSAEEMQDQVEFLSARKPE